MKAYTLGHLQSYDTALADGPVTKVGMKDCCNYTGGCVFFDVAAAVNAISTSYGVYELHAQIKDIYPLRDGWYLLNSVPIGRRVYP